MTGGPYLLNQRIPVQVTIANHGDTDATGVKAGQYAVSGSYFYIGYEEWGDLSTFRGAGITVHGEAQQWNGVPVARFYIQAVNGWADSFDLEIPLKDPASGKDVVAGLVYGDRNGNGAPDAGECLAGAELGLYAEGRLVRATTDGEGRFRIADLPVRVYSLSISNVPDGWVVEGAYGSITVDGSGATANLVYRGVRPLSDELSASMRFTQGEYRVGDRAVVEVALTNSGDADITGIKAGCDRSGGEGPELRDVDLGELDWNAAGVTVRAGETRTFTFTGSISEESGEYGGVSYPCDFGPGADPTGYPTAVAWAKVLGGQPGDASLVFYHDRDGDLIGRPDEKLADVAIGLKDVISGRIVAKGRTDAEGRVSFKSLPSGPYEVRVYGPWKFLYNGPFVIFVGSCYHCRQETWINLVPSSESTPEEDVTPVDAAPGGETPTTTVAAAPAGPAAGGGGLADTGASVLGLLGLGALALLAGLGALRLSRRRTA